MSNRIEPGADGPFGQGIEGADDILEADRARADDEPGLHDFADEFGQDDTAAADQENRPGDEMVPDGVDEHEADELAGDGVVEDDEFSEALDDPALAEAPDLAAGLDGTVDGSDPLAGELPR